MHGAPHDRVRVHVRGCSGFDLVTGAPSPTRIRAASAADRNAARAIVSEYCDAIDVVERDDDAAFDAYLGPEGGFWFAERDGTVVGCVALRPLPSGAPSAAEIKRLYVRPSERKAGVAAALMDALEEGAARRGYDRLFLDTYDGLADAVRFYERRGYVRVPRYNANPQATVFMAKSLAAPQTAG